MKYTLLLAIVALIGSTEAVTLEQKAAMKDFNGADEDEIMDKVFSKYSQEGTDHNGVKNGQRILMKTTAPKAAGVILEATHKLKGNQVPGYIKANFEKAWAKFDINQDGFVKAEETHTFMRSLMGKLNKFALAPGSLSDIAGGSMVQESAPKPTRQAAAPVRQAPVAAPALAEAGDASDAEVDDAIAAIKATASQQAAGIAGGDESSLLDVSEE
jgi:hypothetical protein